MSKKSTVSSSVAVRITTLCDAKLSTYFVVLFSRFA